MALLTFALVSQGAMAQSAGDTLLTVGGVWLDFANSSASGLQSSSQAGTFTSPGTNAEIHNAFAAELLVTHFFTDNIAAEVAMGSPPTLNMYAQGNAAPLGTNGPNLPLGNMRPFASTRAWPAVALLKYYFLSAQSHVRPFVGLGANYTWYSNINLNPAFAQAAQSFAGPGGTVKASLSPSWNPVVAAGVSYELSSRWYATASLVYFPLKTNATITSVAANGTPTLTNKTRITADPVAAFLGIGYRF